MRKIFLFSVFVLSVSCSSIRVFSDHDKTIDFSEYTTYAFFKPGIEEVEISDLDKRRILKAIESQMETKGLTISSTPDLLVNIAVKATDRVIVNNNLGWGGAGAGAGVGILGYGVVITPTLLHRRVENYLLTLSMQKLNFWFGKEKDMAVSMNTVINAMSASKLL